MGDDFFGDSGWDGSLDDIEAAQAVAEPETVEAPVEEAPEETPEAVAAEAPEAEKPERDRDEQGRFLPKKIEVDDPDVQSFLAKYGDDPVKALQAAAEEQRTRGSLNNELGQLRSELAELRTQFSQPQPVPTQITEDLIDRDPAAATALAYEQGNQQALNIAYSAWKDDDPAAAAVWAANQAALIRERAYQERIEQLESRITPYEQSREEDAFAREVRALGPDAIDRIQQNADTLDPAVSGMFMSLLESGTPAQKIGALRALDGLTQGREAPPATPDDVRKLAREQALEADAAIAEAAVVSATATKSEPPRNLADRIGDEWAALERPLSDGWNVG